MKRKILLVSMLSLSLLLTSCHASKQPVSESSEPSSETEALPSDETILSDTTELSTTQPAQTTTAASVCSPNTQPVSAPKKTDTAITTTQKKAQTAGSGTTGTSLTPISITRRVGETVNLRGTEIAITKAEITHEFPGMIEMIPADNGYCYVMLTFHIKNVNSANRFFLRSSDIHFFNSIGSVVHLFFIQSPKERLTDSYYSFNLDKEKDDTCTFCYSMEEKYASSYKIELKPKTFDPIIDTVTFTK